MSETFCYNADPSEGNYTILNNTCIRDKRLSLKAKGLHTYFMSLPPNWNLYKSELVKHSRDGIDSVNSAIKELVELGYVEITEQKRSADGRFAGKAYGFHAKPINTDEDNRHGFPVTVKPLTDKPFTENPQLLTTNILNTNLQKTKLTNYDSKSKENIGVQVSESVFIKIIKELFGGEYPFDKDFESGVRARLSEKEIDESNLESYLKYVFERTKVGNVQKSFEGLYRVLALSNSVVRDFKNSNYTQQPVVAEKNENTKNNQSSIKCPICGSEFEEFNYYCPKCNLSVDSIKENDEKEIFVKKKLFEMTDVEREQFYLAQELKLQSLGKHFFVENEKEEFLREYGILDN